MFWSLRVLAPTCKLQHLGHDYIHSECRFSPPTGVLLVGSTLNSTRMSTNADAAKTRRGFEQSQSDCSVSCSVRWNDTQIDILPESLGSEKSMWEYYNEMAAVVDDIREVEWRDLADTVLVFVCMALSTVHIY